MNLLNKLLKINENQVFDLALSIVKKHYEDQVYYRRNHYIFAKGEGDICLISHIDTLRDERTPLEIIEHSADEYIDMKIYRKIKEKVKSILKKYRTETDLTEYINNIIQTNGRYNIV